MVITPFYVLNNTLYKYLKIPFVADLARSCYSFDSSLDSRPYPLIQTLS